MDAKPADPGKLAAADAAVALVRSGQVVGLGSGSTATVFIRQLAVAVRAGRLRDLRGVPTSKASEALARELGLPLVGFDEIERCDVTVDGADEVARGSLDAIKGLGGALLREKIVAQNTTRFVIIVDESKVSDRLGRSLLPVEVLPFGLPAHERFLRSLGLTPTLRMDGGAPYTTDNGNYIFNCGLPAGVDPRALAAGLAARAGIVEHGMFLGMAERVLVGTPDGATELTVTHPNEPRP